MSHCQRLSKNKKQQRRTAAQVKRPAPQSSCSTLPTANVLSAHSPHGLRTRPNAPGRPPVAHTPPTSKPCHSQNPAADTTQPRPHARDSHATVSAPPSHPAATSTRERGSPATTASRPPLPHLLTQILPPCGCPGLSAACAPVSLSQVNPTARKPQYHGYHHFAVDVSPLSRRHCAASLPQPPPRHSTALIVPPPPRGHLPATAEPLSCIQGPSTAPPPPAVLADSNMQPSPHCRRWDTPQRAGCDLRDTQRGSMAR